MRIPARFRAAAAARLTALGLALTVLSGCLGVAPGDITENTNAPDVFRNHESVLGSDGLTLGGRKQKEVNSLPVNSYLWRAAIDTVSFIPLAATDPFGGAIITDWSIAPATPDERFKIAVQIAGPELRAQNLKVSVYREVLRDGAWLAASVAPETAVKLEDAVLTRARQLRAAKERSER